MNVSIIIIIIIIVINCGIFTGKMLWN